VSRIVDLTMPIQNHFRWPVDRLLRADFANGAPFQITYIGLAVHAFTHIDSPRHMLPEGKTTSEVPLEATIGEAAVVDLADIGPNAEIRGEVLERRLDHVRAGDIAILKTCWDTRRRLHDPAYWHDAPWLSRSACERLLAARVRAVGVDFPQDYPIRGLLDGRQAPVSEFVSHNVLLRNGIILIEYLCNLAQIRGNRTQLFALPLKIPDADGAPARVIAIEPD
jgi:kynurenine formamidase